MNPRKKSSVCAKLFKAFRVILIGLFGVQASLLYVAQRDIELPDFVCKWVAEKFAPEGTRLEIGSGTLRRLAFLELRKISIAHESSSEPTVSLRTAGAYFNWKNIVSPNKNVQTFFFDGIELRCPASLSQTGKPEIVLSDGRINAAYSFGEIYLKDAVARIGEFPFYASGAINISLFENDSADTSEPAASTPAVASGESAKRPAASALTPVFKFAGTLSSLKRQVSALGFHKNVSVQAFIESTENDTIATQIDLFCEALEIDSACLALNKLSVQGSVELDPSNLQITLPTPLRASVGTLSYALNPGELFDAWEFSAEKIEFAAHLNLADKADMLPQKITLAAQKIQAENFLRGTFELDNTLTEIDAYDWGKQTIDLTLNTQVFGSDVAANIRCSDAGTKVILDTEPDIPSILKIPQVSGVVPDDIRKLTFAEKPSLRADITLSPEFDFVCADYALNASATSWDTLKADCVCSYGSFTKDNVNIRLARADGERYGINARIFFELNEKGKYRVQTFGSTVNPEVLDDYFGWFWWRIWNNLSIPKSGRAPRLDLDVYGSLDPDSDWEYIYGAIAGENAVSGGVLVDKASLRIAEEPTVISAFDMYFRHGTDRVTGTLQWHYALEPEYHFRDFRFEFTGSMPPADVFNIVGEGLPEIFDGILKCESSGTASARGFISGNVDFYPQERLLVEVDVLSTSGQFSFLGIEGSDFTGKINYDSGNVRVGPFAAKCGPGNVEGDLLVLFPPGDETEGTQVRFNLEIADIPKSVLSSTLDKLTALGKDDAEVVGENPATENPGNLQEDLSRIAARFKGGLTLPDINSLQTTGQFSLHDPELFELQILGGFSRFLQTMKIPITSFAFTDAQTNFTLENGKVYLPDLKIHGESGELDVQLNVDITTQALEGNAVFKNRRFTQIPILGKVIDWASETTTLIPIGLSGTLNDIKWIPKPFSNLNPNRENPGEAPRNGKSADEK